MVIFLRVLFIFGGVSMLAYLCLFTSYEVVLKTLVATGAILLGVQHQIWSGK